MAAIGSTDQAKKQLIVSPLCRHFSLDPKSFSGDVAENDLQTLFLNIMKSAGKDSLTQNDEVMKWIAFAESFPGDSKACIDVLSKLNGDLAKISVLCGNGLRPSGADIIVFSTIYSCVIALSNSDQEKLPHVMRWMDYIQSKEDFGESYQKLPLEKAAFDPPLHGAKTGPKLEGDSGAKKAAQNTKTADKSDSDPTTKTSDVKKAVAEKGTAKQNKKSADTESAEKDKKKKEKEATQEKKKAPQTEVAEKDKELSVSLLNIQVGVIRKAWKHPSADSLLVEEIDVGEAKPRQVVSGLAKYCNPDELTNRGVVLITNVKPGKLRDVVSEGLVLCASNEDHTAVEPLLPPEGAKPGERVSFSGIDGKPEDVLNPKKKQLEKITPNLFTDEKGVATFKGIPFLTSAGPCTSSITKGSIK